MRATGYGAVARRDLIEAVAKRYRNGIETSFGQSIGHKDVLDFVARLIGEVNERVRGHDNTLDGHFCS